MKRESNLKVTSSDLAKLYPTRNSTSAASILKEANSRVLIANNTAESND